MKATGFLCQAEEGERGRESNVLMTCNLRLVLLVLFGLSLGGRGELVHFPTFSKY